MCFAFYSCQLDDHRDLTVVRDLQRVRSPDHGADSSMMSFENLL